MKKERFNEIKSMIKRKINKIQGGLCNHLDRIELEGKISLDEYIEFKKSMELELCKITDNYYLTGIKSNNKYARYKFPNNEERINFLEETIEKINNNEFLI